MCQNPTDNILLQQLKWPIETMYVGMKIADYNSNVEATNRQNLAKWDKFCLSQTRLPEHGITLEARIADWLVQRRARCRCYLQGNLGAPRTGYRVVPILTGSIAGGAAEIVAGDLIVIRGVAYTVERYGPTTLLVQNAVSGFTNPCQSSLLPLLLLTSSSHQDPQASVSSQTRTIDRITVTAHGIYIYNDFSSMFNSHQLTYAARISILLRTLVR
jgi:hypothetical protein